MTPDEKVRFAGPAFRAYGEFLDRVNRRFAEAVGREGWRPTQPGFWDRFVRTGGPTAVLLVDALRYDTARRLRDLLGGELDASLGFMLGVLPGVTELGMAALLPGAEAGLEPRAEDFGLRVFLGGDEVGTRAGRRAWLGRKLGRRAKVVDLDELDHADLTGIELLVVQSRELDEFGTFAAGLDPQGLLEMVGRIARGMGRLKERGFVRFIVAADHGFLFVPPGSGTGCGGGPDGQGAQAPVCRRERVRRLSGEAGRRAGPERPRGIRLSPGSGSVRPSGGGGKIPARRAHPPGGGGAGR